MSPRPTGWKKLVDYHLFKSAVNRYLHRHAGGDTRPAFHDIAEVSPELDELTRHWAEIRAELDGVADLDLPRYHDVDPGELAISGGDGDPSRKWSVYMLHLLGHRIEENRARCPVTSRLIDRVPNMIQAFFSILDPRKSVPLHDGPYLGYLRYHLGLRVPETNPPKIIVAGEEHTWREGGACLFDDSWPHQVINEADSPRAVLIVDILRPLPPVPHAVNRFVTDVIARHTYGRSVARRVRTAGAAGLVPESTR